MKILVMALFERNSQNPKIMQKLCDEWQKMGNTVVRFHPCTSNDSFLKATQMDNTHAFIFPSSDDYNLFLTKLNASRTSIKQLLLLFLKYPKFFGRFVAKRLPVVSAFVDESNIIKREIERICRKTDFDVIVAGSNPLFLPLGLAKARCQCTKIWYQMDPHSTNGIMNKNLIKERKKEEYTYSAMDKIFVQPNAMKEIAETDFSRFFEKVQPAFFPLIAFNDRLEPDCKFFLEGKINCVFAGALMLPIRRPEYMLRLFSKLKNANIQLYIWCGNLTRDMERELTDLLPANVMYCGSLPQRDMERVMCGADILVNLGNSVSNQFPSKILDYISLRKPIINIYKISNCPTLEVLKNYPYVINVDESIDSNEEARRVENFIQMYAGKLVDKEFISKEYAQYFPENSARAVIEGL